MAEGAARSRGPTHKSEKCFPSASVWTLLPGTYTEPRDAGLEPAGCTSGPGATPPRPATKSEGISKGHLCRRPEPRQRGKGLSRAPLRQRLLEPAGAPTPGHLSPGPAPPARRSLRRPTWPRERLPWIRWLPHPTAPAPVFCGRLGSGSRSGSGRGPVLPPARPPPGTGRPAPPADPPRGRGPHRQPQGGGGGASRAPDTTNPARAVRLRVAAGIGRRLVRAVKGAPVRRIGREGTAPRYSELPGGVPVGGARVSLSQ